MVKDIQATYYAQTEFFCRGVLASLQGGTKNGANGPSYLIANILKTPRPNSVEIGELRQNYMLNTVINFLFKNFIVLWRHLAKTQLVSFIHTVQIDLNITQ